MSTLYNTSEWKGHTLLELPTNNPDKPFRFGISKARTILVNIDALKAFVDDQDTKAECDPYQSAAEAADRNKFDAVRTARPTAADERTAEALGKRLKEVAA